MTPAPLLEVQNLTVTYGSLQALRNWSWRIFPGEIRSLLGPNGAGKSTALRCILGLEPSFTGEVLSPELNRPSGVHYVPQASEFPTGVRVGEVLDFVRAHYSHPYPRQQLLEAFSLSQHEGQRACVLSGGQKRCLSMACAVAGRPRLTVLDEPTVGVDVEARKRAWEFLRQHQKSEGASFILTTHMLEEAQSLSDHITILSRGQTLMEGTVADIQAQFQQFCVEFLRPGATETEVIWVPDPDTWVRENFRGGWSGLRIRAATLEEILSRLYQEGTKSA